MHTHTHVSPSTQRRRGYTSASTRCRRGRPSASTHCWGCTRASTQRHRGCTSASTRRCQSVQEYLREKSKRISFKPYRSSQYCSRQTNRGYRPRSREGPMGEEDALTRRKKQKIKVKPHEKVIKNQIAPIDNLAIPPNSPFPLPSSSLIAPHLPFSPPSR